MMTTINEVTSLLPRLHEYRSTVASFAVLVGGSMIHLRISHGTQFQQLATGIAMAAITLTVALALLELCWRVGLLVATLIGSETRNEHFLRTGYQDCAVEAGRPQLFRARSCRLQ
jgi:hypothetical protein